MVISINISETLIKRITRTKEDCSGKLFGTSDTNVISLLALQSDIPDAESLEYSFPTQLEFCGVFQCESEGIGHQKLIDKHNEFNEKSAVLIYSKVGSEDLTVNLIENGKLSQVKYSILTEEEINALFLYIRVTGHINLQCELSTNALNASFHNIEKTISSGAMVFNIAKTNIFLLDSESENSVVGANADMGVNEICDDSNIFNEEANRKKKIQVSRPRIVNIDMLRQVSKFQKDHAPLCILDKNTITAVNTTIKCDSILMINRNTKVGELYPKLLNSVRRSVKLNEAHVLNTLSEHAVKSVAAQTYHFYPRECGHFLTLIYPRNASDVSLKSKRQILHKQLLIETSAPMFRRANQYVFKYNSDGKQPLINPHEGLKSTDNGKYEYYHYCQNKMDDNGWGCAYRSLQTLASWFKLQGYVDREVPTFSEIQKCLVDIKDKPASFAGSRQWIGSTEVNFVLNTLLGVENKILYVSSGADMASKGPELVSHFHNHGSPVMIGGGVLAHTILGVDYNQQTGNMRFLILDPHYTGGEDLHVIQSKGWCGWKTVDFWSKTSYYNMCLPQVPREV
ncbi:unnamed protein product [Phaedon cochleariae]|uniref:Probable Ufm1-specific protease 2 n=1 Tax=Phaedon cochleariae TaxID=80249 RepID=A0A9P0DPG4_PHACE|nr:unnamed protein product [Phaedon cochleariae]